MKRNTKFILIMVATLLIIIISIWLCIKLSNANTFATFKSWFQPSLQGFVIYVALLIFQVLFLPVSSMVIIVPAMIMFGSWCTFFLSLIGLCIGALITYYLGFFCRGLVNNFISKNATFSKWNEELKRNSKFLLPYFSIIPIFPDQIICLISGVLKINLWFFMWVILVTRAIHLFFMCFLGSIIPMHGWWLFIWIAIFVLITIISFLINKNQEKIKTMLLKSNHSKYDF